MDVSALWISAPRRRTGTGGVWRVLRPLGAAVLSSPLFSPRRCSLLAAVLSFPPPPVSGEAVPVSSVILVRTRLPQNRTVFKLKLHGPASPRTPRGRCFIAARTPNRGDFPPPWPRWETPLNRWFLNGLWCRSSPLIPDSIEKTTDSGTAGSRRSAAVI